MNFFELEQEGIVIKDIRKAKRRKAWPWVIGIGAAITAMAAWAVWDLMTNYIF